MRLERPGQIAYRDRRRGWSLVFLCLVFPVALLLLQEAFHRQDRPMTIGMAGASLAALVPAFTLMRSNTLLIDRLPVHEEIAGPTGRAIAGLPARDLGIPLRTRS